MSKDGAIRIGVMLRAIDETGGIGVYALNIVKELLRRDRHNQYVLYYWNEANVGRFADHANVTERHVDAPNKAFWDQLAIPIASMNDRIDVLFHPKFTVPFLARCKTVMVVHGADWFMPEQAIFYHPWDVRYVRTVMPWYFKKASLVLSVSQLTTDNFESVLDLPEGKIETVYFGPAEHFGPVRDPRALADARTRYGLPERFIFTLTKVGDRNRKNFRGVAEAYRRYHETADDPLPLVVGGKDCHRLVEAYDLPRDGWGADLRFPGWIDQEDLPSIYSSAELFLYASNLEAFPIPITEAMACGTPIVTSDVNGLDEIAGDAALRVDPKSPEAIAAAMARVLEDAELRCGLAERGLERAKRFTWERCGEETLRRLEALVRGEEA